MLDLALSTRPSLFKYKSGSVLSFVLGPSSKDESSPGLGMRDLEMALICLGELTVGLAGHFWGATKLQCSKESSGERGYDTVYLNSEHRPPS